MSLIVKADLEARHGAAVIDKWSLSSDANVTEAIEQAESRARSAALNVFTAASWDAMTSVTLPAEAKLHLVSDAADILSAGKSRPEDVGRRAEEAAKWRSWLASNKVRCFDDVLTAKAAGAGVVLYELPSDQTFDNLNEDSPSYWRDMDI